jgi:hypothetical protein
MTALSSTGPAAPRAIRALGTSATSDFVVVKIITPPVHQALPALAYCRLDDARAESRGRAPLRKPGIGGSAESQLVVIGALSRIPGLLR